MGKGKTRRNGKGRRAWFKPFAMRSLNTGPSKITMVAVGKRQPDGTIKYHAHNQVMATIGQRNQMARSLRDPERLAELNRTYPAKMDLEKFSIEKIAHEAQHGFLKDNPRAKVKLRIENMRLQKTEKLDAVVFHKSRFLRIICEYYSDEATISQLKYKGGVAVLSQSITYSSMARARQAYLNGDVCWKTHKKYLVGDDGKIIPPSKDTPIQSETFSPSG